MKSLLTKNHIGINRTICVDKCEEIEDSSFLNVAKQVLQRDKNMCRLCGFVSSKFQQVITANDRYTKGDFLTKNMLTVCPSCYAGQRFASSVLNKNISLVYLPEISQPQINHLQRLLCYFNMYPELKADQLSKEDKLLISDITMHTESIEAELLDRKAYVSNLFPNTKLSRYPQLCSMLFELSDSEYQKRGMFFSDIRYLVSNDYLNTLMKDVYFAEMEGKIDPKKGLEDSKVVLKAFTGYDVA